jgi:hypothetical protein
MVNVEAAEEGAKVTMVEAEDGGVEVVEVEVEVEECQGLILWMKHSISTFRCMPTVRSAQLIFFFFGVVITPIQLILQLHLTGLAEEVILVKYHNQILSLLLQTVLQTGDEAEVFVVEVEDILR